MNAVFLNSISAYLAGSQFAVSQDISWERLLQLSKEQKLTMPVYEVLRDSMPGSVQRYWRLYAMQEIVLQARKTAEFLEVYQGLRDSGAAPVIVKGLLCRQTYPLPDARISSDEDLYVRRAAYPQFHQAMLKLGFEAEEPDYANAHEARYLRDGLLIEGHWELFPQDNTALNALNTLNNGFWRRVTTQEIGGVPLFMLEPTDHMTFLLLHAFKHFINSGVGVRQLMDAAQWSRAYQIEWPRVREAMRLAHAEYFAAAVFDAGEKYFGMTPPADWPKADCGALLEDALSGGIYGSSDMSRKHSGSMTLAATEDASRATKGKSLLRTIFPNRAVMEMSYPWVKKSAVLLPAAWTMRIVRYLGEGRERNSAVESVRIGAERIELLREYRIL